MGEVTQIIGASGSGLSSFAQSLRKQRAAAVVLQDSYAHITYLRETVIEEVAFGLEQAGLKTEQMHERLESVLSELDLQDLSERRPDQLSGGQTRRLALACVLVLQPEVLVLDDSFAGLDDRSAAILARLCNNYDGEVFVLGYRKRMDLKGEVKALVDGEVREYVEPESRVWVPRSFSPQERGEIDLGEVQASRGDRPRRWWRRGRDQEAEFSVGPLRIPARGGRITWLRGANGTGKTSILRELALRDTHVCALLAQRAQDHVIDSTVGALSARAAQKLGVDPDVHPLDLPLSTLKLLQVMAACERKRPVLLLDEPEVGLDDAALGSFYELVCAQLEAGTAVIMTCHDKEILQPFIQAGVVLQRWVA